MKKVRFNKILDGNTFPIGAYCGAGLEGGHNSINDYNMKLIRDCGLNFMVSGNSFDTDAGKALADYYNRYNIGHFIEDNRIPNVDSDAKESEIERLLDKYTREYRDMPCFLGMYFRDEPPREQFGVLAKMYRAYASAKVNGNPYVNLLPATGEGVLSAEKEYSYEKYVEDFIETCHPSFLSFDSYFFGTGLNNRMAINGNTTLYTYNVISTQSKKHDIPFWAFVACGGQWQAPIVAEEFYPSKAQFDLAVNISLAFGAQGIEYFPFRQVSFFYEAAKSYEVNGMVGFNDVPNKWYYYAKEFNAFLLQNGGKFLDYEHLKVMFLGGSVLYPTFGGVVIDGNSFEEINYAESEHAVVGIFAKDGKRMLYAVNNSYSESAYIGFRFTAGYDFLLTDSSGTRKPTQYELRKENCLMIENIQPGEALMIEYNIG